LFKSKCDNTPTVDRGAPREDRPLSEPNVVAGRPKTDDSPTNIRQKLTRFARKPLSDKWAMVRAKLRNAIGKSFGISLTQNVLLEAKEIKSMVERSAILAKEQYVRDALGDERYANPKRLERYGFKVYSQFDEDGIIQEIFRRIGTTDRRFVEFGVENGLENNTLKLLVEGWRGLWIEDSEGWVAAIRERFADVLSAGRLTLRPAFVTAENIGDLIAPWATGEIDLLSIDIDGNDFHIWEALHAIRPRVIVIEYNAKFPPPMSIVQEYQPDNIWKGTDYMGASLEALVRLGSRLGYSLVGTNFVGLNAFFVRNDLLGGNFQAPFSAENHYNRAKYFLWKLYVSGHPPDWGPYVYVPDDDLPLGQRRRSQVENSI
jgi:hypothetical protein